MDTAEGPVNHSKADLQGTVDECVVTGRSLVIELPDHRLVSIQPLEPAEDDHLADELLAANPAFQAAVERSKNCDRIPFPIEPSG